MNKNEDFGTILKKERLQFKDNKELEKYYHNKWDTEGYTKGYTLFGINISSMYHKERQASALKNLNLQKDDIVLDAGCGNGSLSLSISEKCKKIYAVDLARTAFKENSRKPPKNLVFKKMNIEELKFRNESFSKIVCVETIEHVLNPDKVLQEFHRVLKPQGILVISYPFLNQTIVGRFELTFRIRKYFPISEHLNEWKYKEAINHFTTNGFELLHSEGIVLDVGLLGRLRTLNKFFAINITKIMLSTRRFPRNSSFVIFVLKKL